ncbi:MAG: hypothetical protein AAGF87_11970, partial [Bacteroidota bacterium]
LVGWLGFSLGKTSKEDQDVSRAAVTAEGERADVAELQLASWQSFIGSLDSLKGQVEEDLEDQEDKLNDAVREYEGRSEDVLGLDSDPLRDWRSDCKDVKEELVDEVRDLMRKTNSKDLLSKDKIDQVGSVWISYIVTSFDGIITRQEEIKRRLATGQSLQSDCEERIEELEDEISDLEEDLERAGQRYSDLRENRDDLRAEVNANSQVPYDNTPHKNDIRLIISNLETISSEIKSGALNINGRRAREEAQRKINIELAEIEAKLNLIQ